MCRGWERGRERSSGVWMSKSVWLSNLIRCLQWPQKWLNELEWKRVELGWEGITLPNTFHSSDRLRSNLEILHSERTVPVLGIDLHLVSHLPQGFFLLLLPQPLLPGAAAPFSGSLFLIVIVPLVGDPATSQRQPLEHASCRPSSPGSLHDQPEPFPELAHRMKQRVLNGPFHSTETWSE